ncbi:MAG: hypothetical protein QM754_10860 [Tepidisphaeraceae bacterium]
MATARASAFGRRGIVNVTSGFDNYIDAQVGPTTHTLDKPTFGDLQLRSDGTLRVLTSRRSGTSEYSNDDEGYFTAKTKTFVQSFGFTGRGTPDATSPQTWQVAKTSPTDRIQLESGEYQTLLVQADGDTNALTIGQRLIGIASGGFPRYATQAISLSSLRKPIYIVPSSLDPLTAYTFTPFARGYFVTFSDAGYVAARKYRRDFELDAAFNGGVQTFTELDGPQAPDLAVDIDGRLLALNGSDINRISG